MMKWLMVAGVLMGLAPSLAQGATYGMAGCGLGSMLVGKGTGLIQVFASTINWPTQPFGITSGTSNCVEESGLARLDVEKFIHLNQPYLARDSAQGRGEHLAAFAVLMGCDDRSHGLFFTMSQRNHGRIFGRRYAPRQIVGAYLQAIEESPELRVQCAGI